MNFEIERLFMLEQNNWGIWIQQLAEQQWTKNASFFSFILLIHKGSHGEFYQEFQSRYDIFCRSGAKGCSDHRFRAPPAYSAQLLTLHQHRANNQYRAADQILPILRVSSNTQETLEKSPIQVLTDTSVVFIDWFGQWKQHLEITEDFPDSLMIACVWRHSLEMGFLFYI